MKPTGAPAAFHLLAKPSGAACNLGCHYCYFLSKELLYPGSTLRMSDEVLRVYLEQLLASHRAPEIAVAWQGGEPTLMGLDFFRRSVRLVEQYKRPGQTVAYSLQTNGTLLDDEWCSFFKEHGFLVGLSLDGPRALHNVYRQDKGGRGSFDQALRGWELLVKHGVAANVLCAVHAANASHPLEVYRFFRDELGAGFVQLLPIVERLSPEVQPPAGDGRDGAQAGQRPLYLQQGHSVSRHSVKAEQYGRFLIEVFEEWVRRDVGRVFVQTFDAALANWYGEPAGVCIFQETCGLALALEHNGDLYACDHYVEPGFLLGNILETPLIELVTSARQHKFGLDKRDTLPAVCHRCRVRFACHGECPRNRFRTSQDGEPGLNYLCAGYKLFFQHVDRPMRFMAALLRQGRAPAEIMALYAPRPSRADGKGPPTARPISERGK